VGRRADKAAKKAGNENVGCHYNWNKRAHAKRKHKRPLFSAEELQRRAGLMKRLSWGGVGVGVGGAMFGGVWGAGGQEPKKAVAKGIFKTDKGELQGGM